MKCGYYVLSIDRDDDDEGPFECDAEATFERVCDYVVSCDKHRCRCAKPIGTRARAAEVRATWERFVDVLFVLARASEADAAVERERADVVAWLRSFAEAYAEMPGDSLESESYAIRALVGDIESGAHSDVAGIRERATRVEGDEDA